MAPVHEPPQTNQQDLAALPSNFHADFNDSPSYIVPPAYEYAPLPRATLPSSAVCPSNMPVQFDTQPQRSSASVTTNTQPLKRRRVSDESLEAAAPIPKKLVLSLQEPSGEFHNLKSEASPYSLVPTPTTVPSYHSFCAVASPHAGSHLHTTSNVSHVSATAAPYTPTVSPAFTTANTEHSPHAPATPAPRPSSTMSNPKLVRTSTIPTHSSPSVNHSAHFSNNNITAFNPYTMYSPHSKARLHLEGDLDEVANVWSQEELAAMRKIIVFEREQKGNDIHASFKVVSQNEWKNHPRTINCIWWKEKKEAFVTSVDTILLLESLVAARFTVEEKNRIRRNLEGFKPLTVSKGKSDSEDFFKVIMGFPNPKPRNIEKDVKVFPWKILSVALQKIIGKYSASYASTAGSMMGQPTKIYRPLEFMTEQHFSASPGPEYCVPMSHMVGYGPYNHGRLSAPATPVPRVHYVPQVSQAQDLPAGYVYAPGMMPPQQHMQPPYAGPAPTQPQPWELPHYTPVGYIPIGPASAPATAYPREMVETADFRYPMNPHMIHQ